MQAEAFVHFPAFELVSHSVDLWPCIIEHCDARTLVCLLRVSAHLAGMVRTELRSRFTHFTKPLLASTVTIDALWLMLDSQGGGVVGKHALAVWNTPNSLPLHSLELSLPVGRLQSAEAWFVRRGYTSATMEVSSEAADVVKNQKCMTNGTVSPFPFPPFGC